MGRWVSVADTYVWWDSQDPSRLFTSVHPDYWHSNTFTCLGLSLTPEHSAWSQSAPFSSIPQWVSASCWCITTPAPSLLGRTSESHSLSPSIPHCDWGPAARMQSVGNVHLVDFFPFSVSLPHPLVVIPGIASEISAVESFSSVQFSRSVVSNSATGQPKPSTAVVYSAEPQGPKFLLSSCCITPPTPTRCYLHLHDQSWCITNTSIFSFLRTNRKWRPRSFFLKNVLSW